MYPGLWCKPFKKDWIYSILAIKEIFEIFDLAASVNTSFYKYRCLQIAKQIRIEIRIIRIPRVIWVQIKIKLESFIKESIIVPFIRFWLILDYKKRNE